MENPFFSWGRNCININHVVSVYWGEENVTINLSDSRFLTINNKLESEVNRLKKFIAEFGITIN